MSLRSIWFNRKPLRWHVLVVNDGVGVAMCSLNDNQGPTGKQLRQCQGITIESNCSDCNYDLYELSAAFPDIKDKFV